MKKLPTDDDESLVSFLKANRPEVPPAAANLEERILQAVELETQARANRYFQHDPAKCRRLWLVPPAIAVGVLFTLGSDSLRSHSLFRSTWATTTPTEAELVSLEQFLEHNWDSLVTSGQVEINVDSAQREWALISNKKHKNLTKSTHQKSARK